jgi:hypothetical protein
LSEQELPGGTIDVGPDPLPRKMVLPRWIKAASALALILAAGSVLMSALLFSRVDDLSKTRNATQSEDVTTALFTLGYRTCARENVDRAYANWRDPEGTATIGLDLLDCTPNLHRMPAVLMTEAQADAFIKAAIKGDLTPAQRGICTKVVVVGEPPVC